jgi:outer membrane immunogenic protein
MMKKFALTCAAVAALSAAPTASRAADIAMAPPLAVPVWTWTGFYVGLHAGYGYGQTDHTDNYNGGRFNYKATGFMGGAQLGYNVQAGMSVYGVELDVGYLGIRGSRQHPPFVGVRLPVDSLASTRADFYAVLAARAGLLFGPNTLIYAKAGIAAVNVRQSFIDDDPLGTTLVAGTSRTQFRFGPAVGGGIEYAFAPNWTVKAEYLYIHIGNTRLNMTSAGGGAFVADQHTDAHTVKVGVNYRFASGALFGR